MLQLSSCRNSQLRNYGIPNSNCQLIFSAQTLWSGYHKMALMSEFLINGKKLAVITFQLEPGLQDQLERWEQVKIMKEFVKDYETVIFAVC